MARKVEARAKARQATADLLERRRERDRKITEAATRFFQLSAELDAAREAVSEAEDRELDAAADLSDLGLSPGELAETLGISRALARSAQRLSRSRAAKDGTTAAGSPVDDVPPTAAPQPGSSAASVESAGDGSPAEH